MNNIVPETLQQFNITQNEIFIQDFVSKLTHDRRLGNKRPAKLEKIVNGYNKVIALVDRFNTNSIKTANK